MKLAVYPGVVIALIGGLTFGCSAMADKYLFKAGEETAQTWTSLERSTLTSGQVNWSNASAPFKKYLLISDGNFLCAVRFVNYLRGQDASAGSIWTSGDETLSSAYEWKVLQSEGQKVKVTEQGKDVVKFTALTGIGRFVVAGGYENIKCGNRKFGWQYPAGINFSRIENSDMKLAPTRWEDINEIKLDDPKLVWYSFDLKRKQVRIPVDNL